MSELFTTASIRRIEARALARLPAGTLMARAAQAVAQATAQLARGLAPGRPILALIGPGNNGGDALLAALRLRQWGFDCRALSLGAAAPSATAAADAAAAWRACADADFAPTSVGGDAAAIEQVLSDSPIVIDGLFGIGQTRPLQGMAAAIAQAVRQRGLPVVAVDVPSGIDADRGVVIGGADGVAICAQVTVTMIGDKPGLHTGAALDHVGRVVVAPLGVGAETERPDGHLFDAAAAAAARPARPRDSHKGRFGHVLVYGGDTGLRGAALLAARSAQAFGAGKTSVGSPGGPLFDPGQPQLMVAPDEPAFGAFDVVVIGCGLGTSAPAAARLAQALAQARALVVDADALTMIANDATLAQALTRSAAPKLLTPHPLEAARLLAVSADAVQADRIGAAQTLAARLASTVLLKGAGSVAAAPDGTWSIIAAGGPALASGGTGDVLAGLAGALLAQRMDCTAAACLAAWAHGIAADRWQARRQWSGGLNPAELPALARDVLAGLNEGCG